MRRRSIAVIALCTLLSHANPPAAQQLDLDVLAKQPGTEVIRRKQNGKEIVEIRRGGVTITRSSQGTVGIDRSGKGAVLCSWEINVSVSNDIDVCFPEEFVELRADLSISIDAINDFIVANSLNAVTKADLEAAIAQRLAKSRSQAGALPGPAAASRHCQYMRSTFIIPMNESLKTTSPDERRRQLADFLSVPRPPVLNPCL